MELTLEVQQKLIERFLKTLREPCSPVIGEICEDLMSGEHSISVVKHSKYTIAEVSYTRNGYEHHFLGVTAKHPNDVKDEYYGIKVAVEKALGEFMQKFYFDELYQNGEIN